MTIDVAGLEIVQYPDAVLRAVAEPIERIDETVRAVAACMLELMHEVDGAGLAAPQVGFSWRMFVTEKPSWIGSGLRPIVLAHSIWGNKAFRIQYP